MKLIVDMRRSMLADDAAATGIKVPAFMGRTEGQHDIVTLERASLVTFLRSRGGDNPFAEDMFCLVLGHEPPTPPVTLVPDEPEEETKS